ncbi:MAG: hypothetical protein QOE28_2318 [Solirubrobacteraceae bacterium]|nr:hypothetical protein [Solirubrobacteraceae bacterium]
MTDILFCSDFPLGYHNREAERKLALLAERGYGAAYVAKLGIRDPGLRHAGEIARRLRHRHHHREPAAGPPPPFATCAPKLLPPRRAPGIAQLNRRWLARQLLREVRDPADTVVWLRFPTPELVPFAERPEWPLVVYEVVDDHARSPGIDDRLRELLNAAETRILARAGLVFAWSEPLAERLAARHANVHLASAAADVDQFAAAASATRPQAKVAAYAGSLDFRFDAPLVAAVARELADWRLRLAGPADPEVAAALAGLPNVELLGRVAPETVPGLLASASVCLMPYRETAFNDNLFPIKLIECLASGRPTVATGIRAARGLSDALAVASGAAGFAAAIRAAAEDPPGAAARRQERAAPYSWSRRIDDMQAALEAALP